MHPIVLSGIRPSFPGLSQSAGQITHVLLTRSPLEYPRKGLSVRLACVKHAASVRPEPGSNSPNKNPHKPWANSQSEKPDKKTPKNWHQKTTTPHTREMQKAWPKNNNKKTKPPNTLLSSQTTPRRPRSKPRGSLPLTRCVDDEGSHRSGVSLWDIVALDGPAASRRLDQVTRQETRSQTTC